MSKDSYDPEYEVLGELVQQEKLPYKAGGQEHLAGVPGERQQ